MMSYREGESFEPANKKKSWWYWPALDTLDESCAVARKTFGGWVFAGMIVLGGAVSFFWGKSPVDFKTANSNPTGALVGTAIELLFVLFASYRIMIGRGWIASWILFAMFVAEALMKIAGAPGAVGWIFFYIAVGSSILAGARACWNIRSRLRAGETVELG